MSSDAASMPKGMLEGTITPTEGGGASWATKNNRPATPSHSPGIGHAFTKELYGEEAARSQSVIDDKCLSREPQLASKLF